MATSLQRQLAALADPSSALLIPERKTASILFSTKEAAGHNRDTFYAIGRDGLRELIEINPRLFSEYETSTLFNKASMEFQRVMEDRDKNEELDKEIEDFLIILSPYFMHPASIKCLEWLVNRFHIQKFNISSILRCIMPYYDTKNFSLVIRVLELERFKTSENKHWNWLISNVQSALPLSKTLLYSNTNPHFINWLFATFHRFVDMHGNHASNLQSMVCFMTSTMVGILNSIINEIPKRKEKNQRSLYRSKGVIHSLWSQIESLLSESVAGDSPIRRNEEIQCMIYVVSSFLGLIANQKPELNEGNEKLVGKTMMYILKNHSKTQTTQVYLLLNLLVPHTNKVFKLRKEELSPVLNDVTAIGNNWDLYNFTSRILLDNVGFKKSGLVVSKIWSMVEDCELNPTQRSHLLKNLYEKLRSSGSYATKKWAKGFLSKFERQYPIEFALICQSDPQFASDLVQYKRGENLILMVQHPDPIIRKSAVEKLLKRFSQKVQKKMDSGKLGSGKMSKGIGKASIPKLKGIKPDSNSTAQAVLPRFQDEDPAIVTTLLKLKFGVLSTLFTPSTLGGALIQIIRKRPTVKCTERALKHLCNLAQNAGHREGALVSKILGVLVPLLFPRKGGVPMKLVFIILNSEFAKKNKFLEPYSSILENDKVSHKEVCEFSFNQLKSSRLVISDEDNLVSKMFSLLPLVAPGDIDRIIKVAESIECKPMGNYPITASDFASCLKAAETKEILSLDFILTTILNLKLKINSPLLAKVFKFVWKISENIEKRNLCVQFLTDFIKRSFSSPEEQINFWCLMIRTSSDEGTSEEEFYMLRTLQYLSVCLEENPEVLKAYICKAGIATKKYGRIGTRSQGQPVTNEVGSQVQEKLFEILLARTLYNDSHRVRTWALNCLSIISKTEEIDDIMHSFLKTILTSRDEILSDKEQAVAVISGTLEKKEFVSICDRFVDMIVADTTERPIAIGLLKLCQPISKQIFARFLPTAKNLLAKNSDSKMLLAVLDCYDASIDTSLEIAKEGLKHKQTYSKILSKLTREVIESHDVKWRKSIFGIIIDGVLNCKTPEIKVAIQRCVRKWTMEAAIISEELDKCIAMEKYEGIAAVSAPPNPNVRQSLQSTLRASNTNIRQFLEQSDWSTRTEVVLELIQSKKRLIRKTKLIRPLFKLLKICIALEEQSPVEYLKQLILTSLTLCCSDDKSQESNDDWIDFNVETVIDCLRCSRNPQTHHHALILLNYAAQLYPEQVLHGVMSLFTFMGNSILRQDDTYSTQLIQQTVTTIIPTFVNTNVVRKYSITRVSAGIYFAFAAAVQDIPVHRRLPVFKSLVETLNPVESMWQLCVIIIDKALTRDKKRSNLTADMELAMDIVGKFEPSVALSTLEKIYSYLMELPIYNCPSEEFQMKRLSQNANSKAVVDLTRKETLRDVEILVYYTLELVMRISATFADLEETKLSYDFLLEKCLSYSRLVSNINQDKIFRLIAQRNLDIVEKLNAALEPNDLVRTVISILNREDLGIKKKVLDILNNRIAHNLEWFGKPEILLELIDPLVEFCENSSDSDEGITVIQTGFISLKLISKHLASSYSEQFVPVFELTFSHTTHENRLLCASAFACIGELFSLKSLILPNLNEVCSSILKAFKASAKLNSAAMGILDQDGDEQPTQNGLHETRHEADMSISVANLLCLSTLTCMTKLCDQLGTFLGAKFLRKALVTVLKMDGIFGHGEKATNRKKIFDQRLKGLLKSIGTKIPLRNSLPSIRKIFKDIINLDDCQHTNSSVLLIDLLKESLANTPKSDFTTLFPLICEAFLVDFLSYREHVSELLVKNPEVTSSVTEEGLIQVENRVLDCLTNGIVLKVSEGVFRSFYHKIFDWAGENKDRLITFYRFSAAAAEKLKSLFVAFAGYVINHGAENLSVDVRLTQSILSYFYHIFSNDREGFITIDRFNALVKPLVDLIESEYTINEAVKIKDINDTLIQLAVATNDLNRWQHLIELISLKSQHPNKKVRLYVISTLAAAANELGKDFLPLLPPAVPFLAELLNDDDEEVEKETKRMLLKLEAIVGEPLQPYFVV